MLIEWDYVKKVKSNDNWRRIIYLQLIDVVFAPTTNKQRNNKKSKINMNTKQVGARPNGRCDMRPLG